MFRELRSAQQADITQLLQASIDSSIHLRALQAAGPRLPKLRRVCHSYSAREIFRTDRASFGIGECR